MRGQFNSTLICIHFCIRDAAALYQVMTEFAPDSVIHFASLKAVGKSEVKPVEYYDVNITRTPLPSGRDRPDRLRMDRFFVLHGGLRRASLSTLRRGTPYSPHFRIWPNQAGGRSYRHQLGHPPSWLWCYAISIPRTRMHPPKSAKAPAIFQLPDAVHHPNRGG